MLTATTESIQLWLTNVFPSLFPFMVSCNILLRLGTAENLSRFLRPFTKVLFGLEGISAFPFFLGILSGYPAGAKLTAQLYEKNLLSKEEAQHLLTFSNNPGPLFLIGTIGVGFFGVPFFGHLLLLSSILSAVTTGILWRFFHKNPSVQYIRYVPPQTKEPLSDLLSASISDSIQTILLVGGYLIFFGAFSEGIKQTGSFSFFAETLFFLPISQEMLQGFLCGILEMTNGTYLLSRSGDSIRLQLSLISFLVSFGGLAISGQTFSILKNLPISKKDYMKGKLMNAFFSSHFCYHFFPFFEKKTQKAVPVFSIFTETAFTLSFLWLLPSLFLFGVLYHAIIHKR